MAPLPRGFRTGRPRWKIKVQTESKTSQMKSDTTIARPPQK
jgi:hypothetical protein